MDARKRINARFGSLMLIAGVVMGALIFADKGLGIPLPFSSVWYRSRVMHVPACIGLFVIAWRLLKDSSDNEVYSSAEPLFESVTLHTRPGCHLCDDAMLLLKRYAEHLPSIESINIDDDEELTARYGEVIPVVSFDGREMFRGPLNERLLDRLIQARLNQRLNEQGED